MCLLNNKGEESFLAFIVCCKTRDGSIADKFHKLLLALLASVLLNAFLMLALFAVVLHLYYKDYCAAQAGDGIGYEH